MKHPPSIVWLAVFLSASLSFSPAIMLAQDNQLDGLHQMQTSRVLSEEPVWSVGLGNIIGLSVSPDGKWIVISSTRSATILDTRTLGSVSTLEQVRVLAFTPDSRSLLVAAPHGTVERHEFRSKKRNARLVRDPEGAGIASLSFSPDGKYIAFLEIVASEVRAEQTLAAGKQGGIRIEQGGAVEVLRSSRVVILAWPSLRRVAERSISEDFAPSSISWSPKSTHLLITGSGATYMLLDLAGARGPVIGKVPYVHNFLNASTGDGHSLISQAAFLDERQVLAVGQSGLGWHTPWTEMFCFDPFEGRRKWPEKADEGGTAAPPEYLSWPRAVSVGARTIAVFSPYQPGIFLLDPETGSLRGELKQSKVRAIAVSPEGKTLFAATPDRIFAYGVADHEVVRERTLAQVAIEHPILSLARSGRGVLSLADGTTRDFDASSGRIGRILLVSEREAHPFLSQDGTRLAVDTDDRITWYGGAGGLEQGNSKGGLWGAYAIAPDGTHLAYANNDEGVTVLSLPEGRLRGHSGGQGETIRFLAFSPDGRTIASLRQWTDDVELWKTSDGQPGGFLPSPGPGESKANLTYEGTALAYSPNGRYVAAALWNGRGIALWEPLPDSSKPPSSRYLHTPEMGHCLAIRFSWDSELLACGEEDGSISLFDVRSGALLERRVLHGDGVTTLHFVEDASGTGLITSSMDGTFMRFKIRK